MLTIFIWSQQKIFLTEKGEKKALEIYERHEVISDFLTNVLKVDAETAEHDACRIEHVISDSTFQGIKRLLKEAEGQ